jgi:hypoxanthine phosphoribosyltransferase
MMREMDSAPSAPGLSPLRVLLTRDRIALRVREMGEQISRDFAGDPLIVVGVLKGAAVFLADLVRCLSVDATFDFVEVSSYGTGSTSSGVVRLLKDVSHDIGGRNVLLVEDILDTGLTLDYLRGSLLARHPRMLKTAVLLDKPSSHRLKIAADYVGFEIGNDFVVGYGLDLNERYRNLPDVCVLDFGSR